MEIVMLVLVLAAPTYAENVKPILDRACIECHQPGRIAPMSLLNYEDVRPWAKSIRAAVERREMPPFHAEGEVGRFKGDPRLTDAEITTISKWAASGARSGKVVPHREPEPLPEWQLGTPDLILDTGEYTAEVNGEDKYVIHFLGPVESDAWVSGIEFNYSNDAAVHHAGVYHDEGALASRPSMTISDYGDFHEEFDSDILTVWVPGAAPTFLDPEDVLFIPKGRSIVLEQHVAPVYGSITNRTQIGLHLYDGAIPKNRRQEDAFSCTGSIEIPAHTESYVKTRTFTPETDIVLTDFRPHMHRIGHAASVHVITPDGRRTEVFSIAPYDFDWQRTYWLAKPHFVPAGSRVIQKLVWRNDSDLPVAGGFRSDEEMGTGILGYRVAERSSTVAMGVHQ